MLKEILVWQHWLLYHNHFYKKEKKMKKLLILLLCCIYVNLLVATESTEQEDKKVVLLEEKIAPPVKQEDEKKYGIAFTLKNGYFYPQDSVLRNIFDQKGPKGGYWVEGAMRYNFWKGLNAEISGSYFKRTGYAILCPSSTACCPTTCCTTSCCPTSCCTPYCNTSCCNTSCCNTSCCTNACECTEVKIPTLGLGLKYFVECRKWLEFFFGAGMRVFFYSEKNSSCYVRQCVNKTTVGGMVNAGFEFNVYKGLFIDIFADYNFGKVKPCCKTSCCNTSCCNTSCCNTCCYSTCTTTTCCGGGSYDINVGGFVGGIGIGYKF